MSEKNKSGNHHKVVIVGGGTAGISVAARLMRAIGDVDIALIEPSEKHYYQPLWTLVGGGICDKSESVKDEYSLIPSGVKWIKDKVSDVKPDSNLVKLASGGEVHYDYLILAPGLQIDWHKIPGLTETLGKNGVCSNYSYELVDKTWEFISKFKGGNAVFTQPNTPVKCGGAPQKIAYLAEEAFVNSGVRERTKVIFCSANAGIFSVKKYANTLSKVLERKQIETRFRTDLIAINGAEHKATFKHLDTGAESTIEFDMIHVTPPMSAPDFIKGSAVADQTGWVDVDKNTLQHKRYENVFALGDASNLPTSKTGAAIRKQSPVVVANLMAAMQGKPLVHLYDGYTSCPLVTGYNSLVLAEFDYDLQPQETFPFDQSEERYSMYVFKKDILPQIYWYGMMKGLV
ncbi:MAG TPA: FAD/NAD(P)-binding oxidoreductase [Candidatus Obscuribacter sp.]|nr:NAD(P)/FAD-dependent oxidoreductase [Candidatus Obscuribacter sp.]HMW89808.1 FAD/NAD(P)-binding oxidoreductase [Candidatus Obscuribacter sp.]HMX44395.1 FAD/NAD(P)-binding oxidoreductase [Candidatus Obscuribacter sp.]HMY52899.1 FAD/NAD(P)-binding oxidoreductase [Candidatus Obscuribacter sp.]HND04389.1 FAD/NAD(P)-binding oxidoreductase [Candidatus Obscuribacter sp.]